MNTIREALKIHDMEVAEQNLSAAINAEGDRIRREEVAPLVEALKRFLEYGDVFLVKANERSPYEQAQAIIAKIEKGEAS